MNKLIFILLLVFSTSMLSAQGCTNAEIFCSDWMQSELNNLNFGCYSLPNGESCVYSIGTAIYYGNTVVVLSGSCMTSNGILGSHFLEIVLLRWTTHRRMRWLFI